MSVYRSILEEDLELGGVLDDDNSVELQQIEDIVADQDANADEQDDAQAAEFGPSDGVDDILDESYLAIAEADMNFNKIMQAIGVFELNESAAGREIVYEATSVKQFFGKAKTWVVNFFKKVWDVLKRFAANISSTFRTNSGFVKKYSKQIEEGYKAYSSRNKENKMKMYPFKNLDGFISKFSSRSSLTGILGQGLAAINTKMTADDVDSTIRNYRKELCGKACSGDEFRGELKDYLYGTKETGLMSASDVIKILGTENKKGVDEAKKAMDDAKKQYREAIKKLGEMEKKYSSENATDNMSAAIRKTDMIKQALSATQVARATMLSAVRARISQARMYGQAYVYAMNRSAHKGFQKESASYGFLSDIELV